MQGAGEALWQARRGQKLAKSTNTTDRWTDRWMHERTYGWLDVRTDRWTDGRMHGWVDQPIKQPTDRLYGTWKKVKSCVHSFIYHAKFNQRTVSADPFLFAEFSFPGVKNGLNFSDAFDCGSFMSLLPLPATLPLPPTLPKTLPTPPTLPSTLPQPPTLPFPSALPLSLIMLPLTPSVAWWLNE